MSRTRTRSARRRRASTGNGGAPAYAVQAVAVIRLLHDRVLVDAGARSSSGLGVVIPQAEQLVRSGAVQARMTVMLLAEDRIVTIPLRSGRSRALTELLSEMRSFERKELPLTR